MAEAEEKRRREVRQEEERRKEEEEIKKGKIMEIKKVAKEWEIWNKEEVVARLEEKAKNLVPE